MGATKRGKKGADRSNEKDQGADESNEDEKKLRADDPAMSDSMLKCSRRIGEKEMMGKSWITKVGAPLIRKEWELTQGQEAGTEKARRLGMADREIRKRKGKEFWVLDTEAGKKGVKQSCFLECIRPRAGI